MSMFSRLSAHVFLLFVSILAAAQSGNSYGLRTGVPYHMTVQTESPNIAVGEVAPTDVECPRAVTLIFSSAPAGVPITFSTSVYEDEESVSIDEDTDVFIAFNATIGCGRNIWADTMLSPGPWTVPLQLMASADFRIYAPTNFRIKRHGQAYRLYSPRNGKDGVVEYNIAGYNGHLNRLGLSKTEFPLLFNFNKAEDYDRNKKSVI